jgi:hypothetical protein
MEMVEKRRTGRRGQGGLVLALAAALALAGCENFGLDIFPNSLQNATGRIDLASRIHAEDGATLKSVVEIERLSSSSSGPTYLFVLCHTDHGTRLIVLDPDSLATKAYLKSGSLGTPLGVDASGNFVSGNQLIDSAFNISNNPYSAVSEKIAVATSSSTNLVLSASSGILSYDERSTDWYSSTVSGSKTIASGATYYLIAAAAPSDGSIRILCHDDSGTDLSFIFSTLAAFKTSVSTGPTIYEYAIANPTAVSITKLNSVSDSQAWLTSDGIIVPSSGNNQSRLLRYGYSAGTEIDSRLFSRDGIEALSFDYEGKVWYYYDSYTGRLYAMRAWW